MLVMPSRLAITSIEDKRGFRDLPERFCISEQNSDLLTGAKA